MNCRRIAAVAVVLALLAGTAFGVALQRRYDVAKVVESISLARQPVFAPMPSEITVDPIPDELKGDLSLFILAGQSNMAGRGDLPAATVTTPGDIFVFGNDYRWRFASEPIDDPTNQVDLVSEDEDAGFGPGLAFAMALADQRPGMVIGLIPCAVGGSSIDQWRRDLGENTLYGSCLKRALAASPMGRVAGILFSQGEADAIDPTLYQESELFPDEWDSRFQQMVGSWREDLGVPGLPVVFAQIGSNTAPDIFINWEKVQEQQRAVDQPLVAMIATDDLPLRDPVHFTTDAYIIIGQRFATAYLSLIGATSS